MLTPLDGQIAAPNHDFAQMECFFRGVGSVFDKGGLLQLGSGELYITQLSGLHIPEKDVYFFPLVLNTGRTEYLLRNTALMSGLCYPDCISTDQPQVSQVLTRQGDFQTVRIIHSEYCPEYIFRIKGILVKKIGRARRPLGGKSNTHF